MVKYNSSIILQGVMFMELRELKKTVENNLDLINSIWRSL